MTISPCVQIKKHKTILLDEEYNHPKTSCLVFSFEAEKVASTALKLLQAQSLHLELSSKSLYIIDKFFQRKPTEQLRSFFASASFSRSSYGSAEAILQGERPAKTMNGKERYVLVEKPPLAIQEIFNLLGYIAHETHTKISTLPWELCDRQGNGSPSLIVNKLERSTVSSRELGRHKDVDPEKNISFGIPVLYKPGAFFEKAFINGAPGKPWLVTLMLYTTASNYLDHYKMGTVFYDKTGALAARVHCRNMRIVIFEGDIEHSIEEACIEEQSVTWRVSTVLKLVINPLEPLQSAKVAFTQFFQTYAEQVLNFGAEQISV
jgi:hypothetical protein